MQTKKWTLEAAVGDGSPLVINGKLRQLEGGDVRDFTHFQLLLTAGSVRVFPSLDGTNFATRPLVLSLEPAVDGSDNVTETQGTFVAVAAFASPNRLYHFFGTYQALKILQKGAGGATGTLFASEK